MGEIFIHIVFEIGCYFVGKHFVRVFIPSIGVERIDEQKELKGWKWKGFTYRKGENKYFYAEAVQLIGMVVVIFLILVFFTFR